MTKLSPIESRNQQVLERIAKELENKKVERLAVFDVRSRVSYCDYVLIGSTTSLNHSKALIRATEEVAGELGLEAVNNVKGMLPANWMLLDYGWIILHFFHGSDRERYDLDSLLGKESPKKEFSKKESPNEDANLAD